MTRVLAVAAAVLLALPAAALADGAVEPAPAGQPQIFAQPQPTPGYDVITVDADCEKPANDGDQTCSTKLQLIVNGKILDERVVTIPLDGPDVMYDVDIHAIRDKAMAGNGKIKDNLKAFSADGTVFLNQTPRTDDVFSRWNRRIAWKCIPGRALRATGGAVRSRPGQQVPNLTLSGVVPAYFNFTTGDQATTVFLNGLAYDIAPHSFARMDCVQFFSSHGAFLVPTLLLLNGSATVSGRPHKQFSAALGTPQATFRSLNHEKVRFTVTENANKHIAEMSVKTGRTLQATHLIGGGADFPCTTGRTVKVGRHGLIR